jgi:hypothetical protein
MDGTTNQHVGQNKPDLERQISRFLSYTKSRFKKKKNRERELGA